MKVKILFTCVIVLLFWGCKKDKTKPDYPEGSHEQINTWILDSLQKYYYWSDALPKNVSLGQAPLSFFNAIRNTQDRFSWLYLPNDASTFILSSRAVYGFDYALIEDDLSHQIFAVIKSILKGSPAERIGLKRGDYIRKINGIEFTKERMESMEKDLLNSRAVRLGLARFQDGTFSEEREINVLAGLSPYAQPSISQILENGGKKIAYIYIDDFSAGTVNRMLSTFAEFKSAGVAELILDLRYNSGGEVSEAAALCAMIASGITASSPFITYKGNKNGGIRNESIGTAVGYDQLIDFKALLQRNLGLSRVFVLTTSATASASELMINNLKPYVAVKVIGARTLGKDEASFLIDDQRSPKKIAWEMYPIIYKLFNARGEGGYHQGIPPDFSVDEFSQLPLLPFGNINDPLLKAALNQITFVKASAATELSIPSKITTAVSASGYGRIKGQILSDTHRNKAATSIVFTHR